MLVLGLTIDAAAQESTIRTVSPSAGDPTTTSPTSTPPVTVPPRQQSDTTTTVRAAPTEEVRQRWHTARVLSVTGSVINAIGTGLSVTSVIYIGVTNYPPNASDVLAPAAKPSDPGPALAYAGASVSAFGFVLNAAGLGYEHHVLDDLGADTGRGLFGAGTAFGIFGFASTGLSYFFGLTSYLNPHDQGIAILATSLTGTALCAIGGLLYATDSSRVLKAWRSVTTF